MVSDPKIEYPVDRLEAQYRRQAKHMASELDRYRAPLLPAALSPLYEKYGVREVEPDAKNTLHAKLCAHLASEVDELVRCGDHKMHQRGAMAPKSTILQEIVDCRKFLYNLELLHGITPEESDLAFHQKSQVVEQRVRLEKLKGLVRAGQVLAILAVELDGVICDLDRAMLGFANVMGGSRFKTLEEHRRFHGQVGHMKMEQEFYLGGGHADCEPIGSVVDRLQHRASTAPLLIVASRDVKRCPMLEWETLAWLYRHGVPYDAVAFVAGDKARTLSWLPSRSVYVGGRSLDAGEMSYVCNVEHVRDLESALR